MKIFSLKLLTRFLLPVALVSAGLNCAKFDPINGLLSTLFQNDLFGQYGNLIITESGGTTDLTEVTATSDTYNIRLPSLPTASVTVSVLFDSAQVVVDGSSISPVVKTISIPGWKTGVTVTVVAVDDTIDESLHISTLSHSLSSADSRYNIAAASNPTVGANITDNDWLDGGASCTLKRRLTISNAAFGTMTDFPMLVRLTTSRITYGSLTGGSQTDIRFQDTAGTVLDHEIDDWNFGGTSIFWVKVPTIAATNTGYIWMYYGCAAGSPAAENINGVWSNNYTNVNHMNGSLTDSTVNGNDGNDNGTGNAGSLLGHARDYGGSDSIDYPNSGIGMNTGQAGTVLAWARPNADPTGPGVGRYIFSHRTGGGTDDRLYLRMYDDGTTTRQFRVGVADHFNTNGATSGTGAGTTAFTLGSWSMTAITWWDSTTDLGSGRGRAQGYFNGLRVSEGDPIQYKLITTSGTIRTGCYADPGCSGEYWDGRIDELRISSVARTANWIAAQYASMSDAYVTYSVDLVP